MEVFVPSFLPESGIVVESDGDVRAENTDVEEGRGTAKSIHVWKPISLLFSMNILQRSR